MFILYTDPELFIYLHHFKIKMRKIKKEIRKKLKLNKFLVKKKKIALRQKNINKYLSVYNCIFM